MGGTKAYVIKMKEEKTSKRLVVCLNGGASDKRCEKPVTKSVMIQSSNFSQYLPSTALVKLFAMLMIHLFTELTHAAAPYYQLVGQANEEARLPCLIGLPTFCGEPYFIAWYKLNSSSKSWDRIEHNAAVDPSGEQVIPTSMQQTGDLARHRNLRERVRFERGIEAQSSLLCERGHNSPTTRLPAAAGNFECAQLSISQLELGDEGQYKCEITFSDSLDFDKCPATTLSQLNVIARPNEPELLVNGRPTTRQVATGGGKFGGVVAQNQAFKEGSQVRLECRSSGGRPAPRIEWLNVSSSSWPVMNKADGWQLMRSWPHKQTTGFLPLPAQDSTIPVQVTSNSMTITLSRHDLQSNFVCLVIPRHHHSGNNHQQMLDEEEKLLKSSAYLNAAYLATVGASINPSVALSNGLWQKWIKLEVQVKPARVRLIVLDLETNSTIQPLQWSPPPVLASARSQPSAASVGEPAKPYYSLLANRLYAIQCLVDDSRPRSQVTWFNRTLPIGVEPIATNDVDYLVPEAGIEHRLSSFTRFREHANGTTSTSSTLLLTTSIWDNFEEFFCRVSNEAFQMDELDQVAPIQSARLQVNYAPFAWLEIERPAGRGNVRDPSTVRATAGADLSLRCWVAANPLPQNTILQIEWLLDGRKLTAPGNKNNQAPPSRLQIERANYLHMPNAANGAVDDLRALGGNQLALGATQFQANKLIRSSSLTINSVTKSDSGNYTCQFKLIPAPSNQQQQQQPAQSATRPIRITSGQANQSIQVDVIEAKPRRPTLRVQSATSDILVYGLQPAPDGRAWKGRRLGIKKRSNKLLTLVVDPSAALSLKCDLATPLRDELAHKVVWYLNGAHLHTSGSLDTFNTSLSSLLQQQRDPLVGSTGESGASIRPTGGSITCAYHILRSSSSSQLGADNSFNAGAMRVLTSRNQLELRAKVKPRLVADKRELIMPQVRSFSEFELSSSPSNKLELSCLAQCEPICSIDWLLNGRNLAQEEQLQLAAVSWSEQQQNKTLMLTTAMDRASSQIASADHANGPLLMGGSFTLVESLIRRANAPTFAWLRASGAISTNGKQQWDETSLDWASKQLMRQAGHELGSNWNVFSHLELTYNQISRLLLEKRDTGIAGGEEITVKCRVNTSLVGTRAGESPITFGHVILPPRHWFPAESLSSGDYNDANDDDDENEVASTLVSSNDIDSKESGTDETPFNLTQLLPFGSQMEHKHQPASVADEMQISILLDKSPGRVQVTFGGIESTSDSLPVSGTITEAQLVELVNPALPMDRILQCRVLDRPLASPKYRWTFTDLDSRNELNLDALMSSDGSGGSRLSLRHFIESIARQRQLVAANLTVASSRVDLVSGFVGNYTCTAFNHHGAKSATIRIQVQGRPICRLALGGQSLSADNELVAKLQCSIYSVPPLIETVWYRGQQQLLINRTSQPDAAEDQSVISRFELPVFVLNKQQEFMLSDLSDQPSSNFKCLARNSIGYSETCELSQADRQILMNALRPLAGGTNPLGNMIHIFPTESKQQTGNLMGNFHLANGSNNGIEIPIPSDSNSMLRFIFPIRLDWLLMAACSLVVLWLIFISSSSFLRRKCLGPGKKNSSKPHTSWRFNPSRSCSNNDTMGVGFQTGKTICVNYYGGSNGDSEHDMMQSACSQSSHYEEFVRENQHQQMLQQQQTQQRLLQQPIHFNNATPNITGHSTIGRRTLKQSSLSNPTAITGLLNVENQYSRQQLTRLNEGLMNTAIARDPIPITSLSTTRYNMTPSSNVVPLINGNGTLTSRINIDQPPPIGRQHYGTHQQHMRNEHIYDDVIYNQMIL